jgi:SAM-dependent methyltransferase
VAALVSVWGKLAGSRPGKWSVWKYNWLANHKTIEALERARPHVHGVLLDVGCGNQAFTPLFRDRASGYVGLDLERPAGIDGRGPDVLGRAEALPIRSSSVDTVLGLALLTYMTEPRRMLEEAHRVMRPGGTLIVEFTQIAPLWNPPHDYWRFTSFGAEHLLKEAGFDAVEWIPIGGLWAAVGLNVIGGVNRLNRGPWRILTEIPSRLLYVIFQLGFEVMDRLFDDDGERMARLVVARRIEDPAKPVDSTPRR